jgi:hypothetical protein
MLHQSLSLDNEVEVGFPRVAQAIVGVVLDLPESRIASRPGVTAADPDINVLDGDVP